MEKFTRFEDSHTGINPFLPLVPEKMNVFFKILKWIVGVPSIIFKLLVLGILMVPFNILHLGKFVIVWAPLIRLLERMIDWSFGILFMYIYGIMNNFPVHHHEQKHYSGKMIGQLRLVKADFVQSRDLIICSSGCFLDFIYLTATYSPVYCTIARGVAGHAEVVELNYFQQIISALGLRHPHVVPGSKYPKLEEILYSRYIERPVVLFIEGTKTNGRGILEPPEVIMDQIYTLINTRKLRLHSLSFRYNDCYFPPYNTTDRLGLCHFIRCIADFYHKMLIIHYFHVEKLLDDSKDEMDTKAKTKIVKSTLMTVQNYYDLSLTSEDHEKFLVYWHTGKLPSSTEVHQFICEVSDVQL